VLHDVTPTFKIINMLSYNICFYIKLEYLTVYCNGLPLVDICYATLLFYTLHIQIYKYTITYSILYTKYSNIVNT